VWLVWLVSAEAPTHGGVGEGLLHTGVHQVFTDAVPEAGPGHRRAATSAPSSQDLHQSFTHGALVVLQGLEDGLLDGDAGHVHQVVAEFVDDRAERLFR